MSIAGRAGIRGWKSVKTVHISTCDAFYGAAIAARRLHIGMQRTGYDSLMYVQRKTVDDDSIVQFKRKKGPIRNKIRRLRNIWLQQGYRAASLSPGNGRFSDCRNIDRWCADDFPFEADMVNLHWVTGFLDVPYFFAHSGRQLPVVWTLHDMNVFTGGCHYAGSCERYRHNCGSCPQLNSGRVNDFSRSTHERKETVLDQLDPRYLRIVCPSNWLQQKASKSSLLQRFDVTTIANGLDLDTFMPIDKTRARASLGIPADSMAILFVAADVNESRKGMDLLRQAIALLKPRSNLYFLVAGNGNGLESYTDRFPVVKLGDIDSESCLANVYSAAEIYVSPTREDNLPNTIMEAMACGTAVVSFDVGGVPELVRQNKTGLLAEPENAKALARCLDDLLSDEHGRKSMQHLAREIALQEYDCRRQAKRYQALYQSMAAV